LLIDDLEPDQQVDLVAVWLGRGDFDIEYWRRQTEARRVRTARTADYLIATHWCRSSPEVALHGWLSSRLPVSQLHQ
jgi:hypothetical protein